MTEKLKQTIKEEVEKLPKEIQEGINSIDWVKIAEEVGKKYLLSDSEINDFQVETLLVLVGLEDGDSYARNIENNVVTAKDEAVGMADEAFEKIFTPIKNIMEENIKKNLSIKNPKPEQTLNFILTGGDYSALVAPTSERVETETSETGPIPPTLDEIKDKLTIKQ
jgi:restriction endonuclease